MRTSALPHSTASELRASFSYRASTVVIGASAGGVEALLTLLPGLPADYPLAIVAVLHLPEDRESVLAKVFSSRCAMRVVEAVDKQALEPGTIHFAPPGYHLLIEGGGTFALSCDAPVRFSRPSIDVLLDSAADAMGDKLVAVLLTGTNEDGARGMAYAAKGGALTIVQDPNDAQICDMPAAAIRLQKPTYILALKDILTLMKKLEFSQ
ncbi:MAG: chemotaxis protein CheB [Ramlibacter sp.]|nr:chemotaxis protein CheB [Ramlibacter sp.]